MEIEIKKAVKEDKAAFVELSIELTKFNKRQHDKYYNDFNEVLDVRRIRCENKFEEIDKKSNMLILMAYSGKKAVGYTKSYIIDQKLRVGYCNELYIKKEARGLGIGKKLLDESLKWMKQKKAVRAMMSVYLWNDGAKGFYEKEGFEAYAVSYEKKIS